jgi:CIC family chloride channel protein
MLCAAIAYITARRAYPESIYSEWLRRRGERIDHGRDLSILERLTVERAYSRTPLTIPEQASVQDILDRVGRSAQPEFPVLDAEGRLVGVIGYGDLRTVMPQLDTLGPVLVAADIANTEVEPVTPDDSLRTVLQRLGVHGGHSLPVVERGEGGRVLGLISRQEVFAAYDRELLQPLGEP